MDNNRKMDEDVCMSFVICLVREEFFKYNFPSLIPFNTPYRTLCPQIDGQPNDVFIKLWRRWLGRRRTCHLRNRIIVIERDR